MTPQSSALFILFLALAVAGYTSFPEGTALTCIAVAGHAIAAVLYSGELWLNDLLIYVLECAFCCCLGMALRWKQDRDAHVEAERTLLRDLTVARRLHDYACNEISNTMLLLDELQPCAGKSRNLLWLGVSLPALWAMSEPQSARWSRHSPRRKSCRRSIPATESENTSPNRLRFFPLWVSREP